MFSVFRSPHNPFLSPSRARAFEALGTFNPSVVAGPDAHHLFYRAMGEPDVIRTPGRGFSTVAHAEWAKDTPCGVGSQVIVPTESWDAYGCEDPRATFFEGKWYVFYTALGGFPFSAENIKCAVAIGDTPTELTEKHLITPFNAKAATLFPERINGEAVLLFTAHTDWTLEHQRPTIGVARAKNIADFWTTEFWEEWHAHMQDHAFPDVRRADTEHMEIGSTPLLTEQGWLLVYSHIQNYYDEPNRLFGIEALLLDRNDPLHILGRTQFPFLTPEEAYERYGHVSNIVFPSGAALEGDVLTVYYGGADTVSASATMSLSALLSSMQEESRLTFMKRVGTEPIISPDPNHEWESVSVSNAAAVDLNGSVHLIYRATGVSNISRMGYARLTDAVHVDERSEDAVYAPRIPEEAAGAEDPRLTQIGDTLHLVYTAYNGTYARGAHSEISVEDFVAKKFIWSDPVLLTPANMNDKDLALFPERIDGKVALLHRFDPDICIDTFEEFPPAQPLDRSIGLMGPRTGMWDNIKVGAAGAPLKVEQGWLFIYHAVGSDHHYRLGAALLDPSGTIVLSRTAAPILEPILPWEREGVVADVVFSCGMVQRDDTLYVYYGGADKYIGVATVSVSDLIKRLTPPSHES